MSVWGNAVRLSLLFLAVVLLPACASDDDDQSPESSTATPTETPAPTWTVERIDDSSLGLQTQLMVGADDSIALATWANAPWEDGLCTEVETNPPTKLRQDIYFGWRAAGESSWRLELVDSPVVAFSPTGLSLQWSPDGQAALAFTGGEPEEQYCGANDAVLATRAGSSWTFETASSESDDSATGEPASDAGFVVGLWPGLTYDAAGEPAILHKDVHYGNLQHDDLYRADAELAWKTSGSWSYDAVDIGEGAGDYGTLLFDLEDRPVAFYAVTIDDQTESRKGVWASRLEMDGSWSRVQLHAGAIGQEIAALIDPTTGALTVAFYSADDLAARVRRLYDGSSFSDPSAWESEWVGSDLYDEGQYLSMAFTRSGALALAYHRCKRVSSSSDGCDANDEAAVLAIEGSSGWEIETVYPAESGSCGEYTALEFDSNNVAHLAFRCTIQTDEGFSFRLFEAIKAF